MSTVSVISVVDDDASVRDSVAPLIDSRGWQPMTFASAVEFLAHPSAAPVPQCLVLEVALPGQGGLDLQRQVAHRGDLPVIFLTARGDVEVTVQAMKAGAMEFLTKPCNADVLLAAIADALERSRAVQARNAEMRARAACVWAKKFAGCSQP